MVCSATDVALTTQQEVLYLQSLVVAQGTALHLSTFLLSATHESEKM